jgi:hypothetical protein
VRLWLAFSFYAMSISVDTDIVAKNPIGNGLDSFRGLLRAKCKGLGISEAKDLVSTFGTRQGRANIQSSSCLQADM